jgi:hypothetical protein
MVGPRIFPKLEDGDENPAANAPRWQTPRRDQVVQQGGPLIAALLMICVSILIAVYLTFQVYAAL